jgi:hypothetical protein
VAILAALRLLRQLPLGAQPALQCHVFACPAIGNAALAKYIKDMGWEHYFNNMLVPGAMKIMPLVSTFFWVMQHKVSSFWCSSEVTHGD